MRRVNPFPNGANQQLSLAPAKIYTIANPADRFELIGDPDEWLQCHRTGQSWRWRNDAWEPAPLNPDDQGITITSGLPIAAPILALSKSGAYKIHGGAKNSSSLSIANPAYSMSEQHPALARYWRYRVYVMNHDTVEKTMGLAKVAAAPTDLHNGSGLPWLTQKINGVDTSNVVVPAGTFVSATDQDVDDIAPAILPLDAVEAQPIARTDSGTAADSGLYPLKQVRTLWINGVRPLSAIDPDWRTRTGLLFKGGGSSYDFVTSNASFALSDSYAYQSTFIEFDYLVPTLPVLTLGDSTNTGVTTTSGKFAPVDEAARLARIAGTKKLVVPLKFASSGRRSAGLVGLLRSIIASGAKIGACMIPYWTVNDGSDAAQFAANREVALQLIAICSQYGIIPILLTPPPYNGIGTGDRLAAWRAARADALSFGNRMLVCDMAGAVCDVTTGQYLAGMSDDGTHYNNASTPIVGAEMYATLRQLI